MFKADDLVIKIFVPKESGINTEYDFLTELSVMKFAMYKGISVPKIIAHGEFCDKYLFRYIVMEYVLAEVSINELLSFPISQKKEFVKRLNKIIFCLHQPFENLPKLPNLKKQGNRTERMNGLYPTLIKEFLICAETQDFSKMVLVHGDITRDNLILCSNGTLTLIDFADCIVAPEYYELPAIIFELFLCDKELISAYIGDDETEKFLEMLIRGISIHLFGGFVLKDYFSRLGIPIDRVKSIAELKQLLRKQFFR